MKQEKQKHKHTKHRLRNYLKSEREKISVLTRREQVAYIWKYYKIWIICICAFIFLVCYISYMAYHNAKPRAFFALYVNTLADVGDNSELWDEFVDYAGFDTKNERVVFNCTSYFDPASGGYSEYFSAFVAYVDSGELDVVTMEVSDLEALGEGGRLLDLSNTELAGDLAEKYADRLLYAVPEDEEYSTDPVPIGIDVSDSILMTKFDMYEDSCAVGISAETSHLEAVEQFLDFIFEE